MRHLAARFLVCLLASALTVTSACSNGASSAGAGGHGAAGGALGTGGGPTGIGGATGASGAGLAGAGGVAPSTGGAAIGTGGAGAESGGNAPGGGAGAGTGGSTDAVDTWSVTSPGGLVRGTVELADKAGTADYPAGKRLYYRTEVGGPSAFAELLPPSPLGITRMDQSFVDGLIFDKATAPAVIDETYTMITGKRARPRNHANERVLDFHSTSGGRLQLVIRAYDDGFAFRYRFPETDATARTVIAEATGFRLPTASHAFMLPYDAAGMYTPGYEAFWQSDVAAGTAVTPPAIGWCLPVLFQTATNQWALLAESDVDGSYFGAHLGPSATNLVYRIALPAANEANGVGVVNPSSTLPWQTPWRVIIAGTSARPIVESTLVTDLARPSTIADTTWIKPGRASWSWWSDDSSPTDYNRLVPFVDLSATMGWEYSLVDANWNTMTNGTWQSLATYAASKSVGLFLWYGSGGPNNSILQYAPRDRMYDATIRKAEFQTISAAGIKGVKVDFFLSDKPSMMQYYLDILKDAADAHLLVNFHGATMPRGWQRTYPNLMTMEAVKGAEEYKYTAIYPAGQPALNTIFPFTRNVVGSMDYTPVTFSDALYPHVTTSAHELALSVVFESGVQHFADRVSGYQSLPSAPHTFLAQVPTTWDDTHFIEGTPGKSMVLARRKDKDWYIGGISGDTAARNVVLALAFLGAGNFNMTLISDGASDRTFGGGTSTVSATDMPSVSMRARGGFVAHLTPAP